MQSGGHPELYNLRILVHWGRPRAVRENTSLASIFEVNVSLTTLV